MALVIGGMAIALSFALVLSASQMSFPRKLNSPHGGGKKVFDRDGRLLARSLGPSGAWQSPALLDELGPHVRTAVLSAEDSRFNFHPGVDPLAIVRAGFQLVVHGRLISGASTITQQLARTTFTRPRSLWGKWQEMALSLQIETRLSKDEIFESYINRVHFGPNIVGIAAAADRYFGKPLSALDLAESASLAGMIRGPSLYNPLTRPDLVRIRRNRVLTRMKKHGSIDEPAYRSALNTPISLHPRPPLPGAHHWVRRLLVENESAKENLHIHSTLDGRLQREVQELTRAHRLLVHGQRVTAASVVIIDNIRAEVLVYVGSPNVHSTRDEGQNDGAGALRQPGSTLKPLLYAGAVDALNLSPATLLPDEELNFQTPAGHYSPQNYDRRFRGPVRARRALAGSLNVPAVALLQRLGVSQGLTLFRKFGLQSLKQSANYYGPALALGDGEVSLLELSGAYSALARGGEYLTPRLLLDSPQAAPVSVVSRGAAALISEILSDNGARIETFGRGNSLDLGFEVAVKTGTSKGYRDSWTLGYTRALTVGVWVGNFNARPMNHATGASAAAPLFKKVMQLAMAHRGENRGAPLHDVHLHTATICSQSGQLAGGACEQKTREVFLPGTQLVDCQLHGQSETPLSNQNRARLGVVARSARPRVVFPQEGMVFVFDKAIVDRRQRLALRGEAGSGAYFEMDGEILRGTHHTETLWLLQPGAHSLVLVSQQGIKSEAVSFLVQE